MEKGIGAPEPYHDFYTVVAGKKKTVENVWPINRQREKLPMAIAYNDPQNKRIRTVTPTQPGGYSMRNVDKMFPIICEALDIDPEFEFEEEFVSDKHFAKTTFFVESIQIKIDNQMGDSREDAKRRCKLAILQNLLERDIISECALEMCEFKEAQLKKKQELRPPVLPAQLALFFRPEATLNISESDAALLFDSLVLHPVDPVHHRVIKTHFVDLISKSASPFRTGICVAKSDFHKMFVHTAIHDPRYNYLITVKESDTDYYSITLNESIRRDLEAFHYMRQKP